MDVLVSGAGVAGPVLAYWLTRHGFSVTVVERAPTPRKTGGHSVGDEVCLFTDLANPTSNKICAAIGFRPVRDFVTYAFS